MTTIPTLSPATLATHYAPILKTRLTTPLSTTFTSNNKYGYSFSENLSEAGCFRSILSTNITTLVTNQLTPKTTTALNWNNDQALLKNTTTKNTNGYYYYSFTSSTNNTVTVASSPTGTGTKSVIVEGGNIQIDANIDYTGTSKTLLLIARKNSSGQGGNIYIHPDVTRLDAIIIADGGSLMNGITTGGTTATKNWITHPTELTDRLTINGRIYSYNTRGGSLVPQTSGTDFDQVSANGNHYIPNATTGAMEFSSTATPAQAAAQDLERFRVMFADGNSQCTTRVNYQAFTTSTLPALLIKPSGFQ